MSQHVTGETPDPAIAEIPTKSHLEVTSDPDSALWQAGADLIADRFVAYGYYPDAESVHAAHSPYYQSAVMLTLRAPGSLDVDAAILLVLPNTTVGQKTRDDLANPDEKLSVFGDAEWLLVSQLFEEGDLVDGTAIAAKERPSDMTAEEKEKLQRDTLRLWGGLARVAQDAGATYALGSMDEVVFAHYYEPLFEGATLRVGPAIDYAGSPSVPALLDTRKLMKISNEAAREALLDGYHSLEGRN